MHSGVEMESSAAQKQDQLETTSHVTRPHCVCATHLSASDRGTRGRAQLTTHLPCASLPTGDHTLRLSLSAEVRVPPQQPHLRLASSELRSGR